jgi:hypothetical protein
LLPLTQISKNILLIIFGNKKISYNFGNIEITKRFPSADNINRIAQVLEVNMADLFAPETPESMKIMASKQELKAKFEEALADVLKDVFK